MTENLEAMLARAQAAEAAAAKQSRKPEGSANRQDDAGVEAQLGKRESLLGEAGKAESERANAATLQAQAETTLGGKEKLTREMEEFQLMATNTVQDREARLVELNRQISEIEGNPAVVERLRDLADEENRRIDVQRDIVKTWIRREDGKEDRFSHLLGDNPDYRNNVAGRHGDDPLVQLESYAMHASGMIKGEEAEVPLAEAEAVTARFSEIRQEAAKTNPDVSRIDSLLSEFLYGRFEHFAKTFDQRVRRAAERFHDYYRQGRNAAAAKNYKVEGLTVEQWEKRISDTLPDVRMSLGVAELAMSGKGYKAKTLAKLGEEFRRKAAVLGRDSNPFAADNYQEPEKPQAK